jgi:hypothetical protein
MRISYPKSPKKEQIVMKYNHTGGIEYCYLMDMEGVKS